MEKALKLVPVYSILLLFTNYYALAFYYEYFGVDISNYLDISELLMISLPMFKNIGTAIFLIVLPFIAVMPLVFLNLMVSPKGKIIDEMIDKKLFEREEPAIEVDKSEIKEDIDRQLGFHLTDQIINLEKQIKNKELTKKQVCKKVIILLFITGCILAFCFYAIQYFIEAFNSVRDETSSFYLKPYRNITILILAPVAITYTISQLFSSNLVWGIFFKPYFTIPNIPILLIIVMFIVSLLYNYADVLKLRKNVATDYYKVYFNDNSVETIGGLRFIGRTKNYMFLLKDGITKTVNISKADSIIIKTSNTVR